VPLFDGKAVLSGVGQSELGRVVSRSGLALTVQACLEAIAHAGLQVDDIDGLCTYPGSYERQPGYAGAGAGDVIDALGLNVSWYLGAGEITGQLGPMISACMAVASGVSRHVLCFRTVKEGSAQRGSGRAAVLPTKTKSSHWSEWALPFGMRAINVTALNAVRYMDAFNVSRSQLAQVALNARRNAARNPNAMYRQPLSMEDYLSARMISSPLCLYDCDVPMDGSTAVVVSRVDTVPKLRPQILIESVGSAVPGRMWVDQLDLCETPEFTSAGMMWQNTRLRPSDVDVAELYDGFSFHTLAWLDALGFCERGGAGKFVEGGQRIALDGELPINTQGGQLSGGRLHGPGFLHECCLQLWGEAGERQVAGAPRVGVVATGGEWFTACMLLRLMN
jgi:acetyl-CoA acetyltransferase